jgi:transposase
MTEASGQPRVVVGVDTHKDTHVAVAVDNVGGLLESASFSADRARYQALIAWAKAFGGTVVFGVEGTGSYDAGLASAIRRSGIRVLEAIRSDRRDRRLRGKSDTINAENAPRAVLACSLHAVTKAGDRIVDMIWVHVTDETVSSHSLNQPDRSVRLAHRRSCPAAR